MKMQNPAADNGQSKLSLIRRRLPVILSQLPQVVVDLGERFAKKGFEFALVGGPVRDALLARPSTDLDFTTNATPEQSEEILKEWGDTTWDIGREFGTIGAYRGPRNGENEVTVEVTTYRTDEYDPTSRKPLVVFGQRIEQDLSRRDFTVNAMAIALPQCQFIDPFDGLSDLAAGLLRTPIKAEASFDDDPLRMMRAARFVAQLDFELEPQVRTAIETMNDRISIVSAERVRDELVKLLLGNYAKAGVRALVDTGLADRVIPEVAKMREATDEHRRHKDVYEHSLIVLQQAIDLETDAAGPVPGPDLVLRLAALLHDIGKPDTRKFEANDSVSFHHHEIVGAKLTAKRLKALRFDKETIKSVSRLVELHLRFHGYGDATWTDSAVRRYVTDAGPLLERLHRLTRADCTTRNQRKAARLKGAYDDLEARIVQLQEQEELAAIRPDLDGQQIMEILGIRPGPIVGKAYNFLMELRLEQGPIGPQAAEVELLKWWQTQA